MKNKRTLIAFASIALLATMGIATSYAAGSFGDKEEFKAQREEHQQEMQQIFEDKDFTSWQGQMMERASEMEERAQQIKDNATQENFDKMIQAHELMQSGDREGAREMMQKVYGEQSFGPMNGFGPGRGMHGLGK